MWASARARGDVRALAASPAQMRVPSLDPFCECAQHMRAHRQHYSACQTARCRTDKANEAQPWWSRRAPLRRQKPTTAEYSQIHVHIDAIWVSSTARSSNNKRAHYCTAAGYVWPECRPMCESHAGLAPAMGRRSWRSIMCWR
jgi:hypothetical protein